MSAANQTRVACPHCDYGVKVRPHQFGRRIRCPSCRKSFTPAVPEGMNWVSRQWSGRRRLFAGGTAAVVLLVAGVAVAALTRRGNELPPDEWTFQEVNDHLQVRGLRWEYRPAGSGAFLIHPPGQDVLKLVGQAEAGHLPAGVVEIRRLASAEAAQHEAERTRQPTYAYQRWLFVGDEAMIAQIRKALGG